MSGDRERGPRAYWPLPEVGSVWRSRDHRDPGRTVEVVKAEEWGFIRHRTLTVGSGFPPSKPTRGRTRRTRWHYVFEPLSASPDRERSR